MERGARAGGTGRAAWWRRVVFAQESGLVLVILVMAAVLAVAPEPKFKRVQDPETGEWRRVEVNAFLDVENLVLVAGSASYIAVMAVGMSAVIILAGVDLSIGSVFGLAAVIGAMAMHALGQMSTGPPPGWAVVALAVLTCSGVGAACGAFNGAMIVGLRVHPFIITLGTMAAFRGVAFLLTRGQSIGEFPAGLQAGFFKASIWGVHPVPVFTMALVGLAGWAALSHTVLGRRVYAIGGNETAARYAGIPVGRVKVVVYTLAGMLAGLSACVSIGYYGAAQSTAGTGYELQVIAAAVIGGASLSGGRGSALGAVLGAFVIQLIDNGMLLLKVDQNYNQVVMGAAIVLAVVLDQGKQRLAGGRG